MHNTVPTPKSWEANQRREERQPGSEDEVRKGGGRLEEDRADMEDRADTEHEALFYLQL